MAINDRVRRFLDSERVAYRVRPHREAFTAQEIAATSHVSGNLLAKVLVLRDAAGAHLMAVLPASCRLDLHALAQLAGRKGLTLVPEQEFAGLFPDCERGAMPPFGNLYDMPVYMGTCCPATGDLVFQAGNHHEVAIMKREDFDRLVKPSIGALCVHALEGRGEDVRERETARS
jgi:Ala-tRNA(Pro) deacylase